MNYFQTDENGCKTRLVWMDGQGKDDWYRWEYQETPGGPYLLAGLAGTADWLGGLTEQEKQWAKSNAKKKNV